MQPTSSPVKVGVIGIGNMGWHHARVLSLLKDANLIGVADPNEARGKFCTVDDLSAIILVGGGTQIP